MATATRTRSLAELRREHGPGERRTVAVPVELRARPEDRTVSGHAAVFDEEADIGSFVEEVAPGAFRDALNRAGADVLLLWSHDAAQPLARQSAGTLELSEDGRGLRFEARLARTRTGDDALELVRSGHVTGCSFGFTVAADTWSERGGRPHRVITRIGQLFEVSLVVFPAYQGTDARGRVAELRARARAAADEHGLATSQTRGRLATRARSPYGIDSPHSFFRDMLVTGSADHLRALSHARGEPADRMLGYGSVLGSRSEGGEQGGVPEARERLARLAEAELRDISTTAGAGGGFVTAGAPAFVEEAFSTAARARAVLPGLLPVLPLPAAGLTVGAGRISSGASAAAQAGDNQNISETDLVDADAQVPVATIAGIQNGSLQLFERSAPGFDSVLARELGEAVATALDAQIINGSGLSGQLTGLLNVTGATAASYTDASPTQAEAWTAILSLVSSYSTTLGELPDVALLHGRRWAWLHNWRDTAGVLIRPELPGVRLVPCMSVPTTLSTDQDAILLLRTEELPLYLSPVRFEVFRQAGSLAGTVRARAYQYGALLAQRKPEAVGILTGTGLSGPPTFA